MNPGSPEDWPISEQRKLFSRLAILYRARVELTDSCLMVLKSISGIRYATEITYSSPALSRRTVQTDELYDPPLWEQRYK